MVSVFLIRVKTPSPQTFPPKIGNTLICLFIKSNHSVPGRCILYNLIKKYTTCQWINFTKRNCQRRITRKSCYLFIRKLKIRKRGIHLNGSIFVKLRIQINLIQFFIPGKISNIFFSGKNIPQSYFTFPGFLRQLLISLIFRVRIM